MPTSSVAATTDEVKLTHLGLAKVSSEAPTLHASGGTISMNRLFVFVVSCLLLFLIAGRADAQWSRFRGPNGSGVDLSLGYPVEFSPTKNVAWKTTVPYGQSSPVVVGTRLLGTASEGERLITFCLDTRTGREVWRRDVRRERAQVAYKANDPASPTPAADENGVVAFFAEFGLVSYN